MKIELKQATVREVAAGYVDDGEDGVVGYGGQLNIRPKYQRNFVYDAKKREAVMQTIYKGFPLNVMYWAVNEDGTFEVLDGQQRTIALCQYVAGDYSITIDGKPMAFHNLTADQQRRFLDYELMVYECDGEDKERLDWFETINIAGETLKPQELRNAVYTGPWLTHAKSIFSRSNGAAHGLASKYVSKTPLRQELLELALQWISGRDGLKTVADYMQVHQHDPNANALWLYFQGVIEWVQRTFTKYRSEMKNVSWGPLYDAFKDEVLDTAELEARISTLMQDPDVTSRKGIYPYVLTGEEKHLNIRKFDDLERRAAYERQNGHCANGAKCKTTGNSDGMKTFDLEDMDADHIVPWSKGGKTNASNCAMLCVACNRSKGDL